MWITYSTAKALNPTAIALGNFDGLHRGHQRVIQPVLNFVRSEERGVRGQKGAQEHLSLSAFATDTLPPVGNPPTWVSSSLRDQNPKSKIRLGKFGAPETDTANFPQNPLVPAQEHAYATVVTFNPHPQEFFSGQARALLTPLEEKAQQLSSWGIEQLVLLPFDRELAALSPQDFVEKILVQQLHTQMISVGEDFCFGKQRSGTATDLQAIASNFGIPVTIVPNFTFESDRISSSAIRKALTEGDLRRAEQLLDRPYILTGTVVKGQQLGRTIGFPTANIQLPPNKFIPRLGVYAVRVFIKSENTDSSSLGFGVVNIGTRPTVNGLNQSVEVHILDWSGDLYGKTLIVQLEEFLRPEQKFASLKELKAQINADCAKAKSLLLGEQSSDYQQVL